MIEGAAEYLSIGPDRHPHRHVDARPAEPKKLPTIKDLFNPYKYFPYRFGQAVWAYIGGKYGDLAVARLMKDVIRGFDYEKAIEKKLGVTIKQLGDDWLASMSKDYEAAEQGRPQAGRPGPAPAAGQRGRPLQHRARPEPGRQALPVHLVARSLLHRHVHGRRQDRQGHPQGHLDRRRPALPEHPVHRLGRVLERRRRPLRLRGRQRPASPSWPSWTRTASAGRRRRSDSRPLGEILNPTWAPDGRRIAFTALTGGTSDLYVYDLEAKTLKPLTSDLFGDLHPAWSPDGRWIAFVSERFDSDLKVLNIGRARLALLDPESGADQAPGRLPAGQGHQPAVVGRFARTSFSSPTATASPTSTGSRSRPGSSSRLPTSIPGSAGSPA